MSQREIYQKSFIVYQKKSDVKKLVQYFGGIKNNIEKFYQSRISRIRS